MPRLVEFVRLFKRACELGCAFTVVITRPACTWFARLFIEHCDPEYFMLLNEDGFSYVPNPKIGNAVRRVDCSVAVWVGVVHFYSRHDKIVFLRAAREVVPEQLHAINKSSRVYSL